MSRCLVRGRWGARGAVAVVAAVPCISSCKPNLDDTVSIVTSPRLLAVRSTVFADEAETPPGGTVQLAALFVDPAGAASAPSIDWAFCTERKPLAELAPVSPLCLQASGNWFTPLGTGAAVSGVVPANACQLFGPDIPPTPPGQPPPRPVDPDLTGGYYQPVRLLAPGSEPSVTVVRTRLVCTLASFSADTVAAFRQRYHRNTNPAVFSLHVKGQATNWSAASDASGATNPVVAGQRIVLEVSWPTCPTVDTAGDGFCGPDETGTTCSTCGPGIAVVPSDCCIDTNCVHAHGCAGAERYIALDPPSGALVARREAVGVAWFATAGAFDNDRTGRSGDDPATTSDNGWQAPQAPTQVTLWVVLRDERGGVGWQQYAVDVR
jgi:hypothetical protein